MKTSQSCIARIEGGKVRASTDFREFEPHERMAPTSRDASVDGVTNVSTEDAANFVCR